MNETPNTLTAELFDAMVATYETWAEPLSARLSQETVHKKRKPTVTCPQPGQAVLQSKAILCCRESPEITFLSTG